MSGSNESMLEMKKASAIPTLKNSDKFKSKTSKENDHAELNFNNKKRNALTFSQRVQSSDPYQISF